MKTAMGTLAQSMSAIPSCDEGRLNASHQGHRQLANGAITSSSHTTDNSVDAVTAPVPSQRAEHPNNLPSSSPSTSVAEATVSRMTADCPAAGISPFSCVLSDTNNRRNTARSAARHPFLPPLAGLVHHQSSAFSSALPPFPPPPQFPPQPFSSAQLQQWQKQPESAL
jgi:hypothetical protein